MAKRRYYKRDELGRFAKEEKQKFVRIPLTFFSEKDLLNQGINQLKKGIDSKQRKIEIHLQKIANPEKTYPEWETFSKARKQRELHHWEKEIETHKIEIQQRLDRIKELEK